MINDRQLTAVIAQRRETRGKGITPLVELFIILFLSVCFRSNGGFRLCYTATTLLDDFASRRGVIGMDLCDQTLDSMARCVSRWRIYSFLQSRNDGETTKFHDYFQRVFSGRTRSVSNWQDSASLTSCER